jgi:O-antigen/teichoic acid export membrane protein
VRRLFTNTAWMTVGLGVAQLLTAVAYWLTARAAGPASFGELAAWVGIAVLVSTAADFGLTAWMVRETARTGSPEVFRTGLGARLGIAATIATVWEILCGAGAAAGLVPWFSLLLGVWVAIALTTSMLQAPLRAAQELRIVALATILDRSVMVISAGVGVAAGAAVVGLVIGMCAGSAAAGIVTWVALDREFRTVTWPRLRDMVTALYTSRNFAYGSLFMQLQRLDVALVQIVAGPTAAGVYAAPARLTNALGVIPTAFSSALFPRMSTRTARATQSHELRTSLTVLFIVMVIVTAPVFIFADSLTAFFLGSAYQGSGEVLRIILISMLVATLNQPLSVYRQARGHERAVARVLMIASVAGLAAVGLGAALRGAPGAAWGLVVLQALILILLCRTPATSPDELPRHGVAPAHL